MKILMITGSYPPDVCGVGDYTEKLTEAIQTKGVDVDIYNTVASGWGTLLKGRILKNYDIVHMQYPTVGFGKSLLPHLFILLCNKKNIITLHEFSQVNLLRRLSILLFKLSKNTSYIFTNEFEQKQFSSNKSDSVIIPIGSNIPVSEESSKKVDQIINFGLIRPNKGIEQFIELAKLFKNKNLSTLKFVLAGMVEPRFQNYYLEIERECRKYEVSIILNLSNIEVSNLLKQTRYAYLPFPDGASDRRGSMLAAMANECIVLTTGGAHTNKDLKYCVVITESLEDACTKLQHLDVHQDSHKKFISDSLTYIKKFDWNDIAKKHLNFYSEVLKKQ